MGKNSITRFQKKLSENDLESRKYFNIILEGLPSHVKINVTINDCKKVFEWYKRQYLKETLRLNLDINGDDKDLLEILKRETSSKICERLLRDKVFATVLRALIEAEINPRSFIQVVTAISREEKEIFLIRCTKLLRVLQEFFTGSKRISF